MERSPDGAPNWHARPRGRLVGEEILQLNGAEILRGMMERRWPPPPLTVLADLRVTDVGLGTATMTMPCTPWWQSAVGVYTAGVLAFLADGALGSAVMTAAPPGFGMTTTGMALNFVPPATLRSRALIGRGRVVHATRNQALTEATLDDARGPLLAHGTSRGLLFPLDAAMLRQLRRVLRDRRRAGQARGDGRRNDADPSGTPVGASGCRRRRGAHGAGPSDVTSVRPRAQTAVACSSGRIADCGKNAGCPSANPCP